MFQAAQGHPTQWLRSTVPDQAEPMQNYGFQLANAIGGLVDWDQALPEQVFAEGGGTAIIPLTMVGFQEKSHHGAGAEAAMTTCWREHSKVRLLEVVHSVMLGGRGLSTSTELPHVVVHPSMRDVPFKNLVFVCPHGAGSTRLMAAHVQNPA